MMEGITKIKELRPGTRDAHVKGTVVEVTPVKDRPIPPKGEPRKVASFVLQDNSGQVRVVVMGNFCRVIDQERIIIGRPLEITWARVRRGQGGEAEILLHKGFTSVQGSPTPDEKAYRERMTYKCFSDVPPIHERIEVVPLVEIKGVFPPGEDWAPDLTLKAGIPPDRLQLHEGRLLEGRKIWDDPSMRDNLCLRAVPLLYGREIYGDLVALTETQGELLVAGEGVYRVKVARENGLTNILARVTRNR